MRLDLLNLVRGVRRSPSSAIAAVATLAIAIGAGASIFAVVDAVLLTPPPFASPHNLYALREIPAEPAAAVRPAVSYETVEAWRARAGSMADIEADDPTNATLSGFGAPARVSVMDVTPGFLSMLGVAPSIGRAFTADDIGQRLVIVSHAFWRDTLGADAAALGRQIVLSGQAHTIVGVLPERFFFGRDDSHFWRPLSLDITQSARSTARLYAIARLRADAAAKGGVEYASGRELERLLSANGSPAAPGAVTVPLVAVIAGDSARPLLLLGGAAALALLVAFVNFAVLLVVRAIDRRRELAIRAALGARRATLVRQLLLEAAVLVAAGTAAGVLAAAWLTPLAARLAIGSLGVVPNRAIVISWRVIAVSAAAGLVCAAVFGTLPVFATAPVNASDALRRGATPGSRELLWRRLFVAGEVAIAFVLLVSLGRVGWTLVDLLRAGPGFDPRGIIAFKIALPRTAYPTDEGVVTFYRSVEDGIDARLGAGAAGVVDELPVNTGDHGRVMVSDAAGASTGLEAFVRSASPGYFDVMRIPLAAGRYIEAGDNESSSPRVVVSRSLARALSTSASMAGQQIRIGSRTAEVVGVVDDVKLRALDEGTRPTIYVPAAQEPSTGSVIVVRSTHPDADVIAVVHSEVARLDPGLPVYGVASMETIIDASPGIPARRLLIGVLSAFALLGVLLSAVGLFGVAAHDVATRRKELALRIALGANPRGLIAATIRQSAVIIGIGLAAGSVLALWSAAAMGSVVSATAGSAAITTAAAALTLTAAGVLGVLPAAIRAARTDPLLALRSE